MAFSGAYMSCSGSIVDTKINYYMNQSIKKYYLKGKIKTKEKCNSTINF